MDREKMKVSEKIDWISQTFKGNIAISELLPPYIQHTLIPIKSPIPVYDFAYEVKPYGAKVLIGGESHGKHIIYTGKVLEAMRHLEVTMEELWNLTMRNGGKIARIDFAIDVMDNRAFTPASVKRRFEAGYADTRLQGSKFIGEGDKIETFYVGSMKSRSRKLRIYDKATEQGMIDKYWTRIELERRRGAHKIAQAHFQSGQTISSLIKSTLDFPEWQLFQKIMDCEKAIIPRETVEKSDWKDRLAWLLTTYPTAIVNVMIDEYNDKLSDFEIDKSDVLNTFAAILSAKIRTAQLEGKLPMSTHETDG